MAEAIIAIVLERAAALLQDRILKEINLVTGIKEKIESLSSELKTIRNVLGDAERRGVQESSVKGWLKRLEETAYEIEDVLDQWDFAAVLHKVERESNRMQKVFSFIPSPCFCSKKPVFIPCPSFCSKKPVSHHDIAEKLESLKEKLDQILDDQNRYHKFTSQPTSDPLPRFLRGESSSYVNPDEVFGRENDKNILVTKLITSGGRKDTLGTRILSIVGGGGLGKTTLAQLVFNDSQVKKRFDLKIWISVSNHFDEFGFAKRITEGIQKNLPSTDQLESLLGILQSSISKKKFLLVLDDVRTEDEMNSLKNSLSYGGGGSKILVTTRKSNVARRWSTIESDICRLGGLSDEEGWSLLRKMCFRGKSEDECKDFQYIGKRISSKYNGFPIAIKFLGSVLRSKTSNDEWEIVYQSKIWELKGAEQELLPYFNSSYNEISPTLKRCFSYCAVFPEDSRINMDTLIGNWIALGYLGPVGSHIRMKGQECFDDLANLSLFQDFEKDDLDGQIIKSFKMHNLVHGFAEFVRKNGGVEDTRTESICQASDVKESRSLFLYNKDIPRNHFDSLTSLRILGLNGCGFEGMPRGIGNLIHLRWMDLSYNRLSRKDIETISKLYNLQFLLLSNCNLEGILPKNWNLIRLKWLDLSCNKLSKKDTETICKLRDLQFLLLSCCELEEISPEIKNLDKLSHLDLSGNRSLKKLPEGMEALTSLQTLNLDSCCSLSVLPQQIHVLRNLRRVQLDGLSTLREYRGGNGWCKLRWLKKSDLSGSLTLSIRLTEEMEQVVADAKAAELMKKKGIEKLVLLFEDEMDENKSHASVRHDVIDALKPHLNLQELNISGYKGFRLPAWITSPLNQLRELYLSRTNHLSSLPPFGNLPCLERIDISDMDGLEFVRREFLGLRKKARIGDMDILSASSSSSVSVATTESTIKFPKLKVLKFSFCRNWEVWEDITVKEEKSAAMSLMPCLTELTIVGCTGLVTLPHRLLRKASSLKELNISDSGQLQQRSGRDKDGSAWVAQQSYDEDLRDIWMLSKYSSDDAPSPPPPHRRLLLFSCSLIFFFIFYWHGYTWISNLLMD